MNLLLRVGRVLRTGVAFATFGLGALVLALLVLPVVRRTGGSEDENELRVQRVIHRAFRAFLTWMERLGLVAAEFDGEPIGGTSPVIVVANHPTLIDVILLISRMPQADCVVKREAWSNPFLRGVVSAAGYVPNDGGAELVETCAARIRGGRSLVLFPEGTRSPRGALGPFRRGAAHVALKAGCPVQPVVIRPDAPFLSKGEAWWQVPVRTPTTRITAYPPMRLDRSQGTASKAAREATNAMRELFSKELSRERWSHVGS